MPTSPSQTPPTIRPVDRVREELLIRRQSTHAHIPNTSPPVVAPPSYTPIAHRFPVIAMWAQSARSDEDGMEEWAVFYSTQPIRIESLEDGDENSILRTGDYFDILLFNKEGTLHEYMSLRTEHIEGPDSPHSITIQTRNNNDTEIRLRLPIACVSMTLSTLLIHLNNCENDGDVDIFPTLLVTEETYISNEHRQRFLSQEARDNFDPNGNLANYALLLPYY
ncbi:hypothetical protein H0H93_010503 [Arthromyces matolae]|nr:hypothetical protein H0H93_010503 [Arthromyces matolae]